MCGYSAYDWNTMAMSRPCGSTSLTRRPPMRSSPVEMSSRPATIRRAVDLPHPDGPTMTRNSPSATSIERSCTAWKPFSYSLFMLSSSTVAICAPECVDRASALDGTGGETGDQRFLGEQEQREQRDRHHHSAGGHQPPLLDQRVGDEAVQSDGRGGVLLVGQRHLSDRQLVEGGLEADEEHHDQDRQGQPHDQVGEHPEVTGPVDAG